MLRRLVKRGAKVGVAVAKLAAKEVRERLDQRSGRVAADPDPPQTTPPEAAPPSAPVTTATETRDQLDKGGIVLLDCREIHEWDAGYIDGATHIPMNELPDRVGELDASKRTIVYCLHGMRSAEVAGWLSHVKGFSDVRSMDGGIVAWYSELGQERIRVVRSEDH